MNILVTAGHNVFVSVSDRCVDPCKANISSFTNASNHSSCWFADGIESRVNDLIREVDDAINGHVPEEHRKNRIDVSIKDRTDIFSFYKIGYELTGTGWRKLTSVKPMEFNFTLKEKE